MTDGAPIKYSKETDSLNKSDDDDSRKDELLKYKLVFELIRKQYENEAEIGRQLDNKAGSLIGYVTIVTGLLIGLGTFSILGSLSKLQYYLPYFGGIVALIVSIVFSLLAVRIRKWIDVPNVEELWSRATKDPNFKHRTVIKRVSVDMIDAISRNREHNENKAKFTLISWYSLVLGLILIFVFAAVFTATGGTVGFSR